MMQYWVVEQYQSGRDKNIVAVCKIVRMEGQEHYLSSSFLSIQQWQNHGKHEWRGEHWPSKTQTERNLEKPLCVKIHFYIKQRFCASHFGRNRKICPQTAHANVKRRSSGRKWNQNTAFDSGRMLCVIAVVNEKKKVWR